MQRNYPNDEKKIKGIAYKQASPLGGSPTGATPLGEYPLAKAGAATGGTANLAADKIAADNFKKFIVSTIAKIDSYEKDGLPPNAVRRYFDEWVIQLKDLAKTNVHQAKLISDSINKLELMYKNIGDGRLRLIMLAKRNWWSNVKAIFTNLLTYVDRIFVRPTTIVAPRPHYLPQAQGTVDVAVDERGDPKYNPETGKPIPFYSSEELDIIQAIYDTAKDAMLTADIAKTDIASASQLLVLHGSAGKALLREYSKDIESFSGSFKSVKFNLNVALTNLKRKIKPPPFGPLTLEDASSPEVLDLQKKLKYAEAQSNAGQRLSSSANIFGSKIWDFNPDLKNSGFRARQASENKDEYALRQAIFATYGMANYKYDLNYYNSEANRVNAIAKAGNYEQLKLHGDQNIYGSKLSNFSEVSKNKGFRPKDRSESKDMYIARFSVYLAYGRAFSSYQLRLHAEALSDKNEETRQQFYTTPANFPALSKELQEAQMSLASYLSDGKFIEPSHVVFGSKVMDRQFRPYDVEIDFNSKIYSSREDVWKVWHQAFVDQIAAIKELTDKLKIVQNIKDEALIPEDYDGVRLSESDFRPYNPTADKNNKTAYMIKRRIWYTYRGLQVALENDIITKDFQRLYDSTVEFIDGIYETIDNLTEKKSTFNALGSGNSPAKVAVASISALTNDFNQAYTTAPWNKSFVVTDLIGSGTYERLLSSIIAQSTKTAEALQLVVTRLQEDKLSLQEMMVTIGKTNKDGKSLFAVKYPKLVFPKNTSQAEVKTYIAEYLKSKAGGGNPESGIVYSLESI